MSTWTLLQNFHLRRIHPV